MPSNKLIRDLNIKNVIRVGENWTLISCLVGSVATFLYLLSDPQMYGDLAYFAFFSNMVSDGHLIYIDGSFGYTPLGILIPGYIFKAGDSFISSLTLYRLLGIANLWILIFFLFKISNLFFEKRIAFLIILTFLGLEVIGNNSVTAFDPKLFVCLTTVIGFYFHQKENYALSSLFFAFGFWTWQPAGVNFIFLGIITLKENQFKKIIPVLMGFIIGSLPSMGYLIFTNQLGEFYQQSLVDRIHAGAAHNLIIPFRFLYIPFKFYQTDLFIFLTMFLGFLMQVKSKGLQAKTKNLLLLTSIWCLLFFKEYGHRDLIAFLGIMVLWSGYLYEWVFTEKKLSYNVSVIVLILLFYFDTYSNKSTLKSEKNEVHELIETFDFQNKNYLTIGPYSESFNFLSNNYPYQFLIRFNTFNVSEQTCDALMYDLGSKIKYLIIDKTVRQKERNFTCGNQIISRLGTIKPSYETDSIVVYVL